MTNERDDEAASIQRGPGGAAGRGAKFLARWRRIELAVGLLLVAAGFVAVALGWYDASGTPDVRRQMQALISGGLGGLAAVVLGAALLQAHVQSRDTRQLASKFDGVTDALLELARNVSAGDEHAAARGNGSGPPADPTAPTPVLASHASYHAAGCDLAADRGSLRDLSIEQARDEGLAPCRVCQSVPRMAAP